MSALPFIDPTAGGGKATIAPAPRPMDLAGKVIGLLDNTKEQGDVILATVASALRSATALRMSSSAAKNTTRNPRLTIDR